MTRKQAIAQINATIERLPDEPELLLGDLERVLAKVGCRCV